MEKSFALSQVFAFITVSLWSTSYVFTQIAMTHFSSSALSLLRCSAASCCLLLIILFKRLKPPAKEHLVLFLAAGMSGFSLYLITFNIGTSMLSATTSCVMISLSPIITAILASLLFKERLNLRQWAATCLAFCGVVVMSLWDGALSVSRGIIWMLVAAILISVFNILQRRLTRQYGALEITAYSFFPGTAMLMVFLPEAMGQLRTAPADIVALVCFMGLFPGVIAYFFWGRALTIAPKTSHVTNYMFLTPFLALVLEYVITGVLPGRGTFVGGGLILASLLLFVAAKERRVAL